METLEGVFKVIIPARDARLFAQTKEIAMDMAESLWEDGYYTKILDSNDSLVCEYEI